MQKQRLKLATIVVHEDDFKTGVLLETIFLLRMGKRGVGVVLDHPYAPSTFES